MGLGLVALDYFSSSYLRFLKSRHMRSTRTYFAGLSCSASDMDRAGLKIVVCRAIENTPLSRGLRQRCVTSSNKDNSKFSPGLKHRLIIARRLCTHTVDDCFLEGAGRNANEVRPSQAQGSPSSGLDRRHGQKATSNFLFPYPPRLPVRLVDVTSSFLNTAMF